VREQRFEPTILNQINYNKSLIQSTQTIQLQTHSDPWLRTLADWRLCRFSEWPNTYLNTDAPKEVDCIRSWTTNHIGYIVDTRSEQMSVIEAPISTISVAVLPESKFLAFTSNYTARGMYQVMDGPLEMSVYQQQEPQKGLSAPTELRYTVSQGKRPRVTLTWEAPSTANPSQLRYEYRTKWRKKKWSPWSTTSSTRKQVRAPKANGILRFEVRSTLDGETSETTQIKVKISRRTN